MSAARWHGPQSMPVVRLVVMLLVAVLIAGCGLHPPAPGVSVRVRNESGDAVYVWMRESSGGYSPIFLVDPGEHGGALSGFGRWNGDAIVLTLECKQVALVHLEPDLPTVVIEAGGLVHVAYGEVPIVPDASVEHQLTKVAACGVSLNG